MIGGNEFQAIYVMWLREMKRYIRTPSRLVATIVQPLFFFFILGSGFNAARFANIEGPFLHYMAPGIIAMSILFSSMFTGVTVIFDRQFGFLQEVLVAPITRFSIIIGRSFGGASIALIQGFIILFIAIGLGVPISGFLGLFLTLIFMVLIAFTAVGFGLLIASKMNDFQGFQLIINLLVLPLIFLSSAFFPIIGNPSFPSVIAYCNPIFYMVDGMRGSLIGLENAVLHPYQNLIIVFFICIVVMSLGSYFFSKSEV